MALLFIDGVSHYATADLTKKWNAAGWGTTVNATAGRRGGGAIAMGSAYAYVSKTLPASVGTLIVGFAFKPATAGYANAFFFSFREGATTHISVQFNAANKLEFRRGSFSGTVLGTSTSALAVGQAVFIEMRLNVHDSTGSLVLRINGAVDLTLSNVDTRDSGTGVIDNVVFGDTASFTHQPGDVFSDIYIADTTGSVNNDFLGDVRVDTLFPTSDGAYSQFTPSTGTTHYTLVDETSVSTTDYNDGTTVGHRDSYGMGNLTGLTSQVVHGVQVNAALNKDDAGSKSAATFVRSGSANSDGASAALGTSQTFVSQVFPTDPATGAAWTEATVNGMEAGVLVTA